MISFQNRNHPRLWELFVLSIPLLWCVSCDDSDRGPSDFTSNPAAIDASSKPSPSYRAAHTAVEGYCRALIESEIAILEVETIEEVKTFREAIRNLTADAESELGKLARMETLPDSERKQLAKAMKGYQTTFAAKQKLGDAHRETMSTELFRALGEAEYDLKQVILEGSPIMARFLDAE